VGSDGQPFTGTAKPSSNGGDGTYTITGSINPASSNPQDETKVEGTLLSHNADYWYVFAEEGTQGSKDRRILVIPADAASEICVVKGTPEQELDQDRDCTY
jgi:uncharacterized protein (DUF39 family)